MESDREALDMYKEEIDNLLSMWRRNERALPTLNKAVTCARHEDIL
jgi:hypothetical protein